MSAERWREAQQWRKEDIEFRGVEKQWRQVVCLACRAAVDVWWTQLIVLQLAVQDIGWMQQQQRRLAEEFEWREIDINERCAFRHNLPASAAFVSEPYRTVRLHSWLDNIRREVDEKVQQLSTLSNLSALVAGFAIIAMVRTAGGVACTQP